MTYMAIAAGMIDKNGFMIAGGTESGSLIVQLRFITLQKMITETKPIKIAVKYPRALIWSPGITLLSVTARLLPVNLNSGSFSTALPTAWLFDANSNVFVIEPPIVMT